MYGQYPAQERNLIQLRTLAMAQCKRCSRLDPRTPSVCPNCLSDTFDAVDVDGSGTLVSWTMIRRPPPNFKKDAPYQVCVVDLDAGPRVIGRLSLGTTGLRVGASVALIEMNSATPVFCLK